MENAVFWDDAPCGCLLVIANIVPGSLILFALMMEAIRSPETSVPTCATRHHIPEDGILHCLRFVTLTGNFTLI
jgi:hypothetical protein